MQFSTKLPATSWLTREFLAFASILLLAGCPAHRQAWLVYVRDVPVARVALGGASLGNVVDVSVQGDTAAVTLRHSGPATLEPLQEPPGLDVTLRQLPSDALARGLYADIERALDDASAFGRDDLALGLLKAAGDKDITRAADDLAGRRVLRRLYDEVTSGSYWGDEQEQAQRMLGLWAQRGGIERTARAIEDRRTKVFPVRKSGVTVLDQASPRVRPSENGLKVSLSESVFRYTEARTLPGLHFELPDDEIVAVKLYDDGGVVRFVPALFLLEVSNKSDMHTLQKCGEMFALGLTLGSGVAASAGGEAASALLWCDRTAITLGILLSVVDDHRGWILERFGESGERFLRYTDGLASLVAFYGLARVVTAAPRVVGGLRRAYLDMKAARAVLSGEEKALLERIGRSTDELLQQADVIPIESARKPAPAPAVAEQPLRATGTEGRLVPAGEAGPGNVVASAGSGKPKTVPTAPRPPSSQSSAAPAGRTASRPVLPAAAAAAREAEVVAALVNRGIPVAQARAIARAATEAGVLERVEALVRNPRFRNPEDLGRFLDGWKSSHEGKAQALEDALARLRKDHHVALENGSADVVDYSTREAIQHKRIFGDDVKSLRKALENAADQLRGGTGEVPPDGFKRVIDIRFDARSSNPLRNADRNMLRAAFASRAQLSGVDRVQIVTQQGTYVFEPPFPIH